MLRFGQVESPYVERTFQKRESLRIAKSSRSWALVNICLAVAIYVEMTYGSVVTYFNLVHPVFWYAECGLAVLFTFNAFVDVMRYLAPAVSAAAVELTPRQKKLLGVSEIEPGFRTAISKAVIPGGSSTGSPITPITHSGHSFHGSPTSFSLSHHHFPSTSPSRLTQSGKSMIRPGLLSHHTSFSPSQTGLPTPPGGFSPTQNALLTHQGSYSSSPPPGHRSHSASPGHSPSFNQSLNYSTGVGVASPQPSSSFLGNSLPNASASMSKSFTGSPLSSPTGNLSALFREAADISGIRQRPRPTPPAKSSPLGLEECMTDVDSFHQYLDDYHQKEVRLQRANPDTTGNSTSSFWNYNRGLSDYTPVLKRYQYQVACRSPQTTKSKEDNPDEPANYEAEEVWRRVGITRIEVDKWVENLRKWISQTILSRLIDEINRVNVSLARIGSEELQIGEVSISTLKQLAVTKGQHVPTLNTIVPFLEVCANQEYLVRRIRALGGTGCMSEFRWNAGGDYKGKAWEEHLPTDAAIVTHMLCTYMDSRLPPHPKFPDGKTFTSQHYIRTPDKPNLKRKDNLCIYQTRITPPHFKVILEDDVWNLPQGRNNMFHAILLFLHHIRTKEHGMLGRVNLGLSGINVLWVLETN